MVNQESFSIGEVAAMVGVSAHALRAWERRYSVITPARTPKNQRRYSMEDVQFLMRVAETCLGIRSVRTAAMTVMGLLPEAPWPPEANVIDGRSIWRDVLDRSRDMVLILDVGGRIVDGNRALSEAVGKSREWLLGRRASSLVVAGDRPVLARGATPPFKPIHGWALRLKTAAAERQVFFDASPIRHAEGSFLVLIGRCRAEAA